MIFLRLPTRYTSAIAVCPDGRTLAVLGKGGELIMWDRQANRRIGELQLAERRYLAPVSLTFNAAGDCLLVSHGGHRITVIRVPDVSILYETANVWGVRTGYFATGTDEPWFIALSSQSDLVECWKLGDRSPFAYFEGRISATAKHFAVLNGVGVWDKQCLKLYEFGNAVPEGWRGERPRTQVNGIWSFFRRFVGLGPPTSALGLHRQQPVMMFLRLAWMSDELPLSRSASISSDGNTLLLGGDHGDVRVWDMDRRCERTAFRWPIGHVHCLALSPDGLVAAAGGSHGKVMLWDVEE
jgi:WD40 repeat protein